MGKDKSLRQPKPGQKLCIGALQKIPEPKIEPTPNPRRLLKKLRLLRNCSEVALGIVIFAILNESAYSITQRSTPANV
jgi:hypothetical protein